MTNHSVFEKNYGSHFWSGFFQYILPDRAAQEVLKFDNRQLEKFRELRLDDFRMKYLRTEEKVAAIVQTLTDDQKRMLTEPIENESPGVAELIRSVTKHPKRLTFE